MLKISTFKHVFLEEVKEQFFGFTGMIIEAKHKTKHGLIFCQCIGYNMVFCPGWAAQFVGVLFPTPKCCGLDFWLGHLPGLQVQSLIGSRMGRQPINVSLSHWCFALSLFLKLKNKMLFHCNINLNLSDYN